MSYFISRRIIQRMQPVPRILHHRTIATQQPPPQQPVSRTKQFMKKYGYVGIGVYLALGTVDLATTMAVISVKGADRVREVEDYMIGKAKGWIGMEHTPLEKSQAHEKPSLTSIFVIAYGIHKTVLLPFRLSLTAAITPAVARRLKNWGWLKNKLVKK
ncbi:hypothetical protein V8B55DRAFT_1459618 [Mucor lusitanicus]|uniref:DUF1279 domain-containing protein n=1 Tax=Mucor circinelloides f. lusitanicus TaxID=29924 RepID=A0A8H4BST4_MUCCL|nr:hypothetical protein FB192DRAFT_1352360 [Mucor lusitanicus]